VRAFGVREGGGFDGARVSGTLKAVVRLHRDATRGKTLLAFADLRVAGFEIRGLRVLEGKEGPYVTFPARRSPGGGFFETVRPLDEKTRAAAKDAVLRAYQRAAAKG